MQALLRQKQTLVTESLIKESLLRQLSYSVKELQLEFSQTNDVFTTNEACNSFIVIMEAIFLHGLKRGIIRSALKKVGGAEETKPQPSFWTMVSSYTHKDTLNTIKKLSQINTDVGRCRVWLRIALNEAGITSYFQAMEKERRPINSSYYNYAFLRDRETCDTACKLLEGIVDLQFDIPVNANILNRWNTEPLMLSGIWSAPLKIPLSNAVDVAEGIEADIEDDDTCSIITSSSVTTLSTILALDENQALKIILETPLKTLDKEVNTVPVSPPKSPVENKTMEDKKEIINPDPEQAKMGNSLVLSHGWSSAESEREEDLNKKPIQEEHVAVNSEEMKTFTGLLESYAHSPKEEENYKSILQQISDKSSKEGVSVDFEVCSVAKNPFEDQFFTIARERGLKSQNYTCSNCQLSIGLNFDEARFCNFTGKYYCKNCHLNESSVIPSRLIFNWDHKKYPVSNEVHSYLSDISYGFTIDIKQKNPKLYGVVPEMQELRTIRFRLNLLRAYLYTCREPVITELQKKIWPKDYMYEHIHLYTLNDLCKVPGGGLAAELNGVINFAREHVLNCPLCSQKGFICEVCRNPKVIYPFDLGSTHRCNRCYAVYHGGCLASNANCPKCKRLRQRITPGNITEDDKE